MKRRDLLKSSIATVGLIAIPGAAMAATVSIEDVVMNRIRETYNESLLFSEFNDVFENTLALRKFVVDKGFRLYVSGILTTNNDCIIKIICFKNLISNPKIHKIDFSITNQPVDLNEISEKFDLSNFECVKIKYGNEVEGSLRYDFVDRTDFTKNERKLAIEHCISHRTVNRRPLS